MKQFTTLKGNCSLISLFGSWFNFECITSTLIAARYSLCPALIALSGPETNPNTIFLTKRLKSVYAEYRLPFRTELLQADVYIRIQS